MATVRYETEVGTAEVTVDVPDTPASLLVLGHGAGGGIDAPDLLTLRDQALAAGVAVARVLQPYRVAGRRAPAPVRQLDTAWRTVVSRLREDPRFRSLPVITGGRSSGARVACRTASDTGAAGVVALAFPLHPPGKPERSRADELPNRLPTLVVNGDRDPFGIPAGGGNVMVQIVEGADHSLRRGVDRVAQIVLEWLRVHGWARDR